jgi:very-short-patch-repair endonuclease/predicted transcriptional regulator of viral defense system
MVCAQVDNRGLMALARSQHGVLTRRQLTGLGMTPRQIGWRVDQGQLRAIHRGVYLIGPMIPKLARVMAAVLACGATARVSHDSAAYLYGLLAYPADPVPIHITVTERHCRRRRDIHLHRTAVCARHEVRERDGIPVTAPVRTLVDFAVAAGDEDLERAVAEAFALRLVGRGQILRELDRLGARPGTRALRRLLDAPHRPARTRSWPERKLLALIRANGLPEPETNVRVGRWEVDFLWRDARLVVEVDPYSTHSSPRAFERDRWKNAELGDLGLAVHRVTPRQLELDAASIVARIARAQDDPDNGAE